MHLTVLKLQHFPRQLQINWHICLSFPQAAPVDSFAATASGSITTQSIGAVPAPYFNGAQVAPQYGDASGGNGAVFGYAPPLAGAPPGAVGFLPVGPPGAVRGPSVTSAGGLQGNVLGSTTGGVPVGRITGGMSVNIAGFNPVMACGQLQPESAQPGHCSLAAAPFSAGRCAYGSGMDVGAAAAAAVTGPAGFAGWPVPQPADCVQLPPGSSHDGGAAASGSSAGSGPASEGQMMRLLRCLSAKFGMPDAPDGSGGGSGSFEALLSQTSIGKLLQGLPLLDDTDDQQIMAHLQASCLRPSAYMCFSWLSSKSLKQSLCSKHVVALAHT